MDRRGDGDVRPAEQLATRLCPEGHKVSTDALYCAVCLAPVASGPDRFWTANVWPAPSSPGEPAGGG